MIIANPIYDSVFKYLMEDARVASVIISTIIDAPVEDIRFTPRERTAHIPSLGVTVFRLDFSAIVRTSDGQRRNVLIEIQKADTGDDIARFRRYLAENYYNVVSPGKEDDSRPPESAPIPIITIYILGYPLTQLKGHGAVKILRKYYDSVTGEELDARSPFVELLTHDSHVIHLHTLKNARRNRLEELMSVFEQINLQSNRHLKEYADEISEELKPVLDRLIHAALDAELRAQMDAEDEVLSAWKKRERQYEDSLKEAIQREEDARQREEEARQREEEARQREEEERRQKEEERRQKEAIMQSAMAALIAKGLSEDDARRILSQTPPR